MGRSDPTSGSGPAHTAGRNNSNSNSGDVGGGNGKRNATDGRSDKSQRRKEVVYNGRTYVLRVMRQQQQQRWQPRQVECGNFPSLPTIFGEEECALDAMVSALPAGTAADEHDEATRGKLERDEEEEAARVLRSWWVWSMISWGRGGVYCPGQLDQQDDVKNMGEGFETHCSSTVNRRR